MATSKAGFTQGTTYIVKGQSAEFVESKAGWHLFAGVDGSEIKARAKDVKTASEVDADEIPPAAGQRRYVAIDRETGKAKIAVFDKDRYVKHDVETESGSKAYDINDAVADLLRGKTLKEAYKVANRFIKDMGETSTVSELEQAYGHLNNGGQRMCLGNKMRGAQKRAAAMADEEAA